MKVALVYDRVNKWGGAERVLLALHDMFPDAPLYTSVYDKKNADWASVFDIKTSFLQKIPFVRSHHELFPFLMPIAFEQFDFDEYDLVISITSEAAKGIITKPNTVHICYCLTPTRYLWSGHDEYFKNNILKIFSKLFVPYLRKWDLLASSRPDVYIAISKEVQSRIKKYYGLDSSVVYPPVGLGESVKGKALRGNKSLSMSLHPSPFFLIVSRLSKYAAYKKIDLAIEACSELGLQLMIVGEGSARKELENISSPTIKFVGKVSDEELIEYYKNCKALIFPGNEDLGLVMIEAQMNGAPVIAFKAGGALEIVKDKKTGLLFTTQTTESLKNALLEFQEMEIDPNACVKNVEKFDKEKFKKNFLSVVNKLI